MRRHHRPADAPGFFCLVAIMDWFTRKVLARRISNTLEADFCLKALSEAIHKFGPLEIRNIEPCRANGSSGQARSGQPVHVLGPDRPAEAGQGQNLHGRQRPMPVQPSGIRPDQWCSCLRHVVPLAIPEVCMRPPARLGIRIASQRRHRALNHLPQPPAPPPPPMADNRPPQFTSTASKPASRCRQQLEQAGKLSKSWGAA